VPPVVAVATTQAAFTQLKLEPNERQSAEVLQPARQIDALTALSPQPRLVPAWQVAPDWSHVSLPVQGAAQTWHQHSEPAPQSAAVSQAWSQLELLPDELVALPHAPTKSTQSKTQNPTRARRILRLPSIA